MISHETYLKIKDWYWVPVFKDYRVGRQPCKNSFKFSKGIPRPVVNPQMHWDHPTWEELVEYQQIFDGGKLEWQRGNKRVLA